MEPLELLTLCEKAATLMSRGEDAGELLSNLVGKADLDLENVDAPRTLLGTCADSGTLDNLTYLLDSKANATVEDGRQCDQKPRSRLTALG